MPSENETQDRAGHANMENARLGYQAAANLWVYEGETLWSKFNALLVANSIVLAALALAMNARRPPAVFLIAMPIAGIILCALWLLLTMRSFAYYRYWFWSAREFEDQYLSPQVRTFSRVADFADGREVTIGIGAERQRLQIGCLARCLRIRQSSYLIIGLFFVVYMVLSITNIC